MGKIIYEKNKLYRIAKIVVEDAHYSNRNNLIGRTVKLTLEDMMDMVIQKDNSLRVWVTLQDDLRGRKTKREDLRKGCKIFFLGVYLEEVDEQGQ